MASNLDSHRSKEVDKYEKRVKAYQADVRKYDFAIKQYTDRCLAAGGGVMVMAGLTAEGAPLASSVTMESLVPGSSLSLLQ